MMMYEKAVPVWIKNRRETVNYQAGFRCDFYAEDGEKYTLKITGASLYRIFINGEFVGYGPARAGDGFMRCDEIVIDSKSGLNKLAVEVAGYNCSSFYILKKKSFLCAELCKDGEVIAYTGRDFKGLGLDKLRNMYCHRYSYQRAYGEVWNFDNNSDLYSWTTADNLTYEELICCNVDDEFIPRAMPMPKFCIDNSASAFEVGTIMDRDADGLRMPRYISNLSNDFEGFNPSSFSDNPYEELYGVFMPEGAPREKSEQYTITNGRYVMFKLQTDNTGFIMNEIIADEDSSVYLFFTEDYYKRSLVFDAIEAQINIVKYNLKKSDTPYKLETFEAYTCKYIGIAVKNGKVRVKSPMMREYSYPIYKNTEFASDDEELNSIFKAAANTFRQNTVDVFMDCPGRERGGWLCDSYFTAQSERIFAGNSDVENAFLSNFTMAKEFSNLPLGMLPHNYPSSLRSYEDGYIPQWAMWYFAELYEYCKRRGGTLTEEHKKLFYGLHDWLKKYENSDGLLEKMPGWNFVEWSAANDWVQDVNYPTNMLYAKVLRDMGELFGDESLSYKADKVKETVIDQSFNGTFFTDNAVRNEKGELINTGNISETCQYYAFFCGVADAKDKRFNTLADTLIIEFGGKKQPDYEIEPAAPFIGKYLRLIMLLNMKQFTSVLNDISGYFACMAKSTGTLWENDKKESLEHGGSLNHGFASFAGVALVMACAGISNINYGEKTICMDADYLCGHDYDISIGTDGGEIKLTCKNEKRNMSIPDGWNISYY